MPNFKVKCGVDGCPDEYKKINYFRKYLRTCHANEYSNNANGNDLEDGTVPVKQPRIEDPPPESQSPGESDDNDDNVAFMPVIFLHV